MTSYLLTMNEIGDNYACFMKYDSYVTYGLVYAPMLIYFLAGIFPLCVLIYKNAYSLSRKMEEYDIPDELRDVISNAQYPFFLFPPLFCGYVCIIQQDKPGLHVLMGILIVIQSLALFRYFIALPPENMDAWIEIRNPIRKHLYRKKTGSNSFSLA